MKKLLTFFVAVSAAIACCLFASCTNKVPVKADENTVIIAASSSDFDFNNKTLKDYMDFLQDSGTLTYSINGGMISEINGKANTTKSYWMLYTDDAENSNQDWGTFEYENSVYGSAALGADALTIKEGCIYIWAYQTF